jgi:hypothetical protein
MGWGINPSQRSLLAGSSYKKFQRVPFRFCQQSGYKPGAIFNRAHSGKRPDADIQVNLGEVL